MRFSLSHILLVAVLIVFGAGRLPGIMPIFKEDYQWDSV